ncbi:NAD(P)H-hydrate dehydratase [Sanguibacter suaedae]|uniref:ADP-dependent (S)-NAD(P)H-hydrate dehydratase n=1 Tax=Sanguibacter suaedae TaxID=2795737 RepID=A0A934M5V4_9MICO|nr:NAD(P)H-hydrate dehydratase [Sanguibacter suaedae]MBI9113532.1 NAD(P)H-hydrate dehydratase [Sanguibacter suaedae]
MSADTSPVPLTPALLRSWGLPKDASSKYERGQVLVVGGARQTPGAVLLTGVSALRVGAGRLTLAVAASVAPALAVAVPEAGVVGLEEGPGGAVLGRGGSALADDLASSDVVVVGPGLDDADEAAALLEAVAPHVGDSTDVLLDAYALGVLPRVAEAVEPLRGRLVLTPNPAEAARLVGCEADDLDDPADLLAGLRDVADRYGAVVTCQGLVVAPGGDAWSLTTGTGGLATSGSGDVLAGAVAGLRARGVSADRAAAWGTHVHAVAGDRLTSSVGAFGFLARELAAELPRVVAELSA